MENECRPAVAGHNMRMNYSLQLSCMWSQTWSVPWYDELLLYHISKVDKQTSREKKNLLELFSLKLIMSISLTTIYSLLAGAWTFLIQQNIAKSMQEGSFWISLKTNPRLISLSTDLIWNPTHVSKDKAMGLGIIRISLHVFQCPHYQQIRRKKYKRIYS